MEGEEKKEEEVNRRSITVQPVSVIVGKCLKKALTPPLTIKNFFKPTAKNSRPTSQDEKQDGSGKDTGVKAPANQGNGKHGKDSKGGKIASADRRRSTRSNTATKSSKTVMSTGEHKDSGSSQTTKRSTRSKKKAETDSGDDPNAGTVCSDGANDIQGIHDGRNTPIDGQRLRDTSIDTADTKSTEEPYTKELCEQGEPGSTSPVSAAHTSSASTPAASASSRPLKRTNEESSPLQPATKKPRSIGKQINIMASFAKQKSIQEERKQLGMSCPICNKQFEAGISNSVVNDHIDNCLIE